MKYDQNRISFHRAYNSSIAYKILNCNPEVLIFEQKTSMLRFIWHTANLTAIATIPIHFASSYSNKHGDIINLAPLITRAHDLMHRSFLSRLDFRPLSFQKRSHFLQFFSSSKQSAISTIPHVTNLAISISLNQSRNHLSSYPTTSLLRSPCQWLIAYLSLLCVDDIAKHAFRTSFAIEKL